MKIRQPDVWQLRAVFCLPWILAAGWATADGIVVNRVYDPYVQALETEIEWRSLVQDDEDIPELHKHSIGVGRSLSERWFAEFYTTGTRDANHSLDVDVFELELKRQITEQGEYAFDWGAVFEIERDVDDDVWEIGATLVSARDIGRWSAIANLGLFFEAGAGVDDELESRFHAQARYRLMELFEPAVEVHVGQDTAALGPAVTGTYRPAPGRTLGWNAGVFWGIDDETPDRIFKLNVEFEF